MTIRPLRCAMTRAGICGLLMLVGGAACTGDDIAINAPWHDHDENTGASHPAVAFGSTPGEFAVAYAKGPTYGNPEGVWLERLNATSGATVGGAGPLNSVPFESISRVRIAYASGANQYLLVFQARPVGGGSDQLYGQRLTAAGAEVGADDFTFAATAAAQLGVTYDSATNEYLVVWAAGGSSVSATVYGQRIDAATGAEVGTDDFVIATGADINGNVDVAFNSVTGEYAVIYAATTGSSYEVFAQRVDGAGAVVGTPVQVSQNGPTSSSDVRAAIAHATAANRHLVVWSAPVSAEVDQVFGQFLDGFTAAEDGSDFQITSVFGGSYEPSIAFAPSTDRFVVVSHGLSSTSQGLAPEIFYQEVDAPAGAPLCPFDVVISDRNPVTGIPTSVSDPGLGNGLAVATPTGRFLATWGDRTFLRYVPPPPPGGSYVYEFDVAADLSPASGSCADL